MAISTVNHFDRWSTLDWYFKIVWSFKDDKHHNQKVEVHVLSRPHNQDDDLVGVGLLKTKEK